MMFINEALNLTNIEEIENEITERIKLKQRMVGTLYPSIIMDEITQLRSLIWELKHK